MFEVGAAHGIFCDEVKKTGVFSRVVAIEPSAQQAQTCRALGLETIESVIEDVQGEDQSADVVAAFEVLEHLSEPFKMIKAMKRMLRPGGLLLLSTPNVKGFEILTLGVVADAVYPEHVTLFSPEGITILMERAGLEIVELTTPGVLDCDIVRNKALEGAFDLSGQAFLRSVIIDQWETMGQPFQEFLSANRLSSHMWVAARRVS
ncbi:MAG: class I SAM-dependent methyltransferase [Devosiaceae bacterium]|nr:class I SAM-dependent methyltransferase [Devosiaceae bacterium]